MHLRRWILASLAPAAAIGAVLACSSGSKEGGPGQLAVELVDAPNPAVSEIWVNVTAVRAHAASTGWMDIAAFDPPMALDLLKLQESAVQLGLANLPAGTVTQLRLLVSSEGNSVTVAADAGPVSVPLKVPSGAQSGIKIKGPWTIDSCTQTTVTLDFDGNKSIWYHPTNQGDQWILRPVIRTKKVAQSPGTCEEPGQPTCVPAECASGVCDELNDRCAPGGPGTPCELPGECLSGVCSEGSCGPGGPGVPCRADADCANGSCGQDSVCTPEGGEPAGSPCESDIECLSNGCVEGSCAPGGQGAPCASEQDCETGFTCAEGSCAEAEIPL
jgi:hypothetical protein